MASASQSNLILGSEMSAGKVGSKKVCVAGTPFNHSSSPNNTLIFSHFPFHSFHSLALLFLLPRLDPYASVYRRGMPRPQLRVTCWRSQTKGPLHMMSCYYVNSFWLILPQSPVIWWPPPARWWSFSWLRGPQKWSGVAFDESVCRAMKGSHIVNTTLFSRCCNLILSEFISNTRLRLQI